MANVKCFGCSFTRRGVKHWHAWPEFLKLSAKNTEVMNFGYPGSSNEYICRQILLNAEKGDRVIVMWSSFDRVHKQAEFDKNGLNSGKSRPQDTGTTYEQLYHRTLEYIWLANKWCENNQIAITNLSMTILPLGETQKLNNFKEHLDVDYKGWPIDLSSFCLENKSLVEIPTDEHPTPSQAYLYHKKVICPALGIEPLNIPDSKLIQMDEKAKKISEEIVNGKRR